MTTWDDFFGTGVVTAPSNQVVPKTSAWDDFFGAPQHAPAYDPRPDWAVHAGMSQEDWSTYKQQHPVTSVNRPVDPEAEALMQKGGAALAEGAKMIPSLVAPELVNTGLGALRGVPYVGQAAKFLRGGAGYGEAGEALPGKINMLVRPVSQAAAGVVQGAAAGAADIGSDEDFTTRMLHGAETGGALGATLGTGSNALMNYFRGKPIGYETAALASRLQDEGIALKPSQLAGHQQLTHDQAEGFTRALARTFGEDLGPEERGLTEDVMGRAAKRIGQDFDEVAKTTNIQLTQKLSDDLQGVRDRADRNPAWDKETANKATTLLDGIDTELLTNGISGEAYQALTKKGGKLDAWIHAKGQNSASLRDFGLEVREKIDDALEQQSGPEAVGLLRRARMQYKNMIVAEDLAEKAPASGVVDPTLLRSQVIKRYPGYAYSGTPGSNLKDLATAGQQFFSKDIEPRTSPWNKLTIGKLVAADLIGGAGFAGATHLMASPGLAVATAAGAGGAALTNESIRAYLKSQRFANALIDRSLNREGALLGARKMLPPAVLTRDRLTSQESQDNER